MSGEQAERSAGRDRSELVMVTDQEQLRARLFGLGGECGAARVPLMAASSTISS